MTITANDPVVKQKELGKEISRFKQRVPLVWWALLFLSILGFILVIFLLQNELYYTGLLHGQAAASRVFTQLSWFPIIFFLLIIISLVGLIVYPRRVVEVHESGLLIWKSQKARPITWEEITGILLDYRWTWVLFLPIKKQQFTIQTYNKEIFKFDERLNNLDAFKDMVEKEVYPLILRRMKTGQEVNAILHFGKIQIYPESGIKFSGKAVQWGKISSLDVREGYLTMTYYADGHGKDLLKVRAAEVPNIPVLLQVADEYLSRLRD
jgi:hypothetical protein